MEERNRNGMEQKRNDDHFQLPCNYLFALVRMRENKMVHGPRVRFILLLTSCSSDKTVSVAVCAAMSLSKFSRRDSSPSSSDSELERLLSKIKRPRVRKRLFRPSSAVITVGSDSSSDGDFKANPEIGTHKTKDKVNKVILFVSYRGRDREYR